MTYVSGWLHRGLMSFISLLIVAGGFFPIVAQAGVVSGLFVALSSVRTVETGTGGGYLQNVQTMSLPRAAMNLDPNPSKGGGDITIVGNAALLSEEGPAGTLADLAEGGQSTQISLYVVREGDTLSGIAEMFDVSVNTIRWGNNISGSTLKVGQTLTVLPVTGVKHEVKDGDTLASIAKKYKGDLDEIIRFNGIGGADTSLSVGTEIIVPDGEIAPAPATAPVRRASLASAPARTASAPVSSGYYIRPVVGGVKTQGIHGYNGIDIAAYMGTQILASAAGEVIVAATGGWNGGYGTYVVLRHDNGTQTLYAHNSQNLVSVGQRVAQGQVIAYMGSTGRSTGPHVHFEIRGARNPF